MPSGAAVVIPSTGRPEILRETIESILEQSALPAEVLVCVIREADFPAGTAFPPVVKRIVARPGAAAQRNCGIEALTGHPLFVAFLDDDLFLHRDYLRNMRVFFESHPSAVVAMGHLLANGRISGDAARALCANPPDLGESTGKSFPVHGRWGGTYGCNLNVRGTLLEQVRFDERLPLYSEMEDVDFGSRARRHGEVWYHFGSLAAHLRATGARISFRRQGFSQIMNPVYLSRKGSMPAGHVIRQFVLRRPLQNLVLALLPSQRTRRLELFAGNLYALYNIARGRIDPERIFDLEDSFAAPLRPDV